MLCSGHWRYYTEVYSNGLFCAWPCWDSYNTSKIQFWSHTGSSSARQHACCLISGATSTVHSSCVANWAKDSLQALSILSRGAGLEASPQPNLEWPGNTEPLCYTGLTCSWGLVAHCVQGRSWRLHIWAGNSRDIKPTQKQKAHWWISSMLLFQEIFLGKILFFPPLETEGVQWCAEASLESSR